MTRRGLAELLAIVAPPACVACREPVAGAEELLCAACRRALPWLRGESCPRCGLPRHRGAADGGGGSTGGGGSIGGGGDVAGRGGSGTGGACPAAGAAFGRAWAPLAYDGSARAVVQALKFHAALPAADLMAAQLAATLPPDLVGAHAVVPVPPQRGRLRARGFDAAGLLARALAARLGLELAPVLRRRDRSARQATSGRSARRAAGRIDIQLRRSPPRAALLLIDDVHTTGATLEACARALAAGGAAQVAAVTYARTL